MIVGSHQIDNSSMIWHCRLEIVEHDLGSTKNINLTYDIHVFGAMTFVIKSKKAFAASRTVIRSESKSHQLLDPSSQIRIQVQG